MFEAKVDAGKTEKEKREVRSARQGTGDIARRIAHRERDEMNKDKKDVRRGKTGGPQFQGKTGAERLALVKAKMNEGVRDVDPEKGTAERKARLEKKRGMKMDDHPQFKKEELSVDDQMKISQAYNRMSPEEKRAANKKAMGNVKKVAAKIDTRTDAQKMTDAVGKPRMGSSD
jgi:hypothetical protein